jgi:hypothetical protein
MGAWGAGPFQNDHALDFLAELSQLPPAGMGSRITSALVEAPLVHDEQPAG